MGGPGVREIHCKTLLNRIDVPGVAFHWSLNPYRGCRYACAYCYARPSSQRWGPAAARDFDRRVLVKVNAPEVLRRELRRPGWRGETIAVGTACDPYEPAESEYRLTRRILLVLREFENPAYITTKGVLAQRDVDALRELGRAADVAVAFSVGSVDEDVWRLTEPGAPSPLARLEAMQFLVENGVTAGVAMAPLLPGISDSSESIEAVAEAAAAHKARFLEAGLLSLKPGARDWFMPLLAVAHPRLAPAYAGLYRRSYAPRQYAGKVLAVVDAARHKWGLAAKPPSRAARAPQRQLQMALTA